MPVICKDCNATCYKKLGKSGKYEGLVIWICSHCGKVIKKVRAG